jgi:hypothetical protein
MTDQNFDLSYLSAGLEELEPYLLSKELFWNVTTPPHLHVFPKLTIGNILLALANLDGMSKSGQLSPQDKTEYARLERNIEALHQKWAVAWGNKANHEYESRLRQWLHYLNELNDDPENNAPYYSTEVRNRVLLELLKESSPESAEPDLASLDTVLRAKLTDGKFVWDKEVQPGYPEKDFWFLYGFPSS